MLWVFLWGVLGSIVIYICACLVKFYVGHDPYEPPHVSFDWPIVGIGFKIWWNSSNLYQWNLNNHKKHGDTISWRFFNINGITTSNPENVQHILKDNFKNYVKGETMQQMFRPFLGHGIFAVNGEKWKKQRKTAAPFFKIRNLKEMIPIFQKNGQKVLKIFENDADTWFTLDLQKIFMAYTMDSIGEVGFGVKLNSLNPDDSEQSREFCRLFDYVQAEIDRQFYNLLLRVMPSPRLKRAIQKIDRFVYNIINKRNSLPSIKQNDILTTFETQNYNNPKELRDIVLNFVIAGRDTTAILLTWTFYELSRNPEIQEQLRNEINEMFMSDYKSLKQMQYLRAVQNEILRLYPPVPANFKQALQDDLLPSGHFVRAGTEVEFNAFTLHRMPIWNWKGDDAECFKPERWLDEEYIQKIHSYQYIPFLAGYRRCLGSELALIESGILICMILQNYTVELSYEFTKYKNMGQYKKSITLPMKDGLPVYINKIR